MPLTDPKPGDQVLYVSPFRTGVYLATLTAINVEGLVNIEVYIPGVKKALSLRALKFGPEERVRPR